MGSRDEDENVLSTERLGSPPAVDKASRSAATLGDGRAAGRSASTVAVLWACRSPGCRAPAAAHLPGFDVHEVDPAYDSAFEAELAHRRPRLIVAEAAWCRDAPPQHLAKVQSAAVGADWLLCWQQPGAADVDLLLDLGARAGVACGTTPSTWARALRAVLAGDLWLPREAERWLYLRACHDRQRGLERHVGSLSVRESEVLDLLRQGLTNKAIAQRLGIGVGTVKKHVARIFEKTPLTNRRQLQS